MSDTTTHHHPAEAKDCFVRAAVAQKQVTA